MRLDKYLANMGVGSRKELKMVIRKGAVTINGHVEKDPGKHVDPDQDLIQFRGETIGYQEYMYIMLHKPAGVISATTDNYHKTVIDLLPEEWLHFEPFPVGRLDIDTEGLLILTNDGQLSHRLLSPKKHVDKTYFAIIDQEVVAADIEAFAKGLTLDDGYETLPGYLEVLDQGEGRQVRITIQEGKFHQVKRMFQAVGKEVTYLKRVSMGGLILDESLDKGQARELTTEELDRVQVQVSPYRENQK